MKKELKELYKVFEGKTLLENIQNAVSRGQTGYDYKELQEVIDGGEDGLDGDEIESVDRTTNLLVHLFHAHIESIKSNIRGVK